jgi:hypothetical protein
VIILLGFFAIPATGFILLQNKSIQTFLAGKVASTVSENLNAEFTVESIDMIFFNRVVMKNVLLRDQHLDTLLYSPNMIATLKSLNRSAKRIEISRLKLKQSTVRLATDTTRVINIKFIVDELKPQPDSNRVKWEIGIHAIEFETSKFIYENHYVEDKWEKGIDFSDIVLNDMDLDLRDLRVRSDSVLFTVNHLDFIEKSGFDLKELSGKAVLNKHFMNLREIHILTDYSNIVTEGLDFRFNIWKDFGNKGFGSKVKLQFDFLPSILSNTDLAYFAPGLSGIDKKIDIKGNISGKINSLKGKNIVLRYNGNSSFEGSFDLIGLPDIQETYMYFDIEKLTTTVADIESMQRPGPPGDSLALSKSLSQLGNINYRGKFTGYFNDFVSYGSFTTDLGRISSDLSIRPDSAENVRYNGRLSTEGFDLGKLLDMDETAGLISMNAKVEGINYKGGDINANMDGQISKLDFNDYRYRNIYLSGNLTHNKFDGSFSIEDPNLKMEFFGKIDFTDTLPVFDFTTNVEKARLHPLNISSSHPNLILSCYLRANFVGANLDDFNGEINLVNSLFQNGDKQIQIYDFNLFAQHTTDTNRMILKSDFVDAEITGYYEFVDIGKASARLLASHLPAFRNLTKPDKNNGAGINNFDFSFNFKNTFPITDFFFPDLEVGKNSLLTGNYNPSISELNFSLLAPELRFRDNGMKILDLSLISNDTIAQIITSCDILESGSLINIEQLRFMGVAQNDSLNYQLNWLNPGQEYISSGELAGKADFIFLPQKAIPRISLEMDPGFFILKDTLWDINMAKIELDTTSVTFMDVSISHNNQAFNLNGKISQDPEDKLEFIFDDFNLYHLNQVFSNQGLELGGVLRGSAVISDMYGNPSFQSDMSIDNLNLNGEELGNTFINANWIDQEQRIRIDARAMRSQLKTLEIVGDYWPKTQEVDFLLSLDKLRLNILDPYLSSVIVDLNGISSGNLKMTGTTRQPIINGEISLQKTSFKVDYLQTVYSFSDVVTISNNQLLFKDFEIYDESGEQSILNGSIRNNNLRDFKFDLNLEADNFHFLATRERHNPSYYGDAFASGLVRFSGSRGDLQLDVSARTDRGTHIFIPINKGRSIKQNNFISFINKEGIEPDDIKRESDRTNTPAGFGLKIELEISPDATTEIIFDPQVGDIMQGKGSGNIQLIIDPQGQFQMFGDYVIESGEYLFTLQNIINKKLEVERGGTIIWNGDPTGAVINMHAIYNSKAAPGVLVPEPAAYLMKRMPVECHLIMTGNLLSPLISFDIEMPTAEEETRNILRNAIGTEEELTKQFLSLLVMNNFSSVSSYAGSGSATGTGVGMAGVTASELLSNQLSNWLSQISNDFDIGVNYRPGDEISSEQVEVALSTQIFDDRVTIHTNLDVSSQSSPTPANPRSNSIAGDFDLDVKITENGKFRFKAYNRYNHDQLYKTSPYTQGIGFIYREDFNNLSELRRRYFGETNRKQTEEE